ncbi:MAG: hypothetical protein ABWZ78_15030, partial [Burkholderiaceae bacterium]
MNATLRRALRGRERPQAARVPAAAVVGSVLAVFAWQTAAVAADPGDEPLRELDGGPVGDDGEVRV